MDYHTILTTLRKLNMKIDDDLTSLSFSSKPTQIDESILRDALDCEDEILSFVKRIRSHRKIKMPSNFSFEELDLLPIQKSYLALETLVPGNIFNLTQKFTIRGGINIELFRSAVKKLLSDHPALTTRFSYDSIRKSGKQYLNFEPELVDEVFEYRDVSKYEDSELNDFLDQVRNFTFDLTTNVPWRLYVLKKHDQFFCIINIHHIIIDGWSLSLLLRYTLSYYMDAEVKTNRNNYIEAVSKLVWRTKKIATDPEAQSFWKNMFSDFDLKQHNRKQHKSFEAGFTNLKFSNEFANCLKSIAEEHNTTMFVIILSIYQIFLARNTEGKSDFLLNTGFSGRDSLNLEPLIGCFVNTIMLRCNIDEDSVLSDVVNKNAMILEKSYQYQLYPVDSVYKIMDFTPTSEIPMPSKYLMLYQNFSKVDFNVSGSLELESQEVLNVNSGFFDLVLFVEQGENGYDFLFKYSKEVYTEVEMKALVANFEKIMEAIKRSLSKTIFK